MVKNILKKLLVGGQLQHDQNSIKSTVCYNKSMLKPTANQSLYMKSIQIITVFV